MPSSSRREFPFRLHARLIALAALCAAVSSAGHAAAISWDGGGSDDNWETPENWTGNQVPGPADDVFFGQLSSKDCVINENQEVADFSVTSSYGGTVSFAGSINLTVNGTLRQEGGTINWDQAFAHFKGNFTRTGGSSAGTFGTFFFDGSGTQSFFPGSGGMIISELILSGSDTPALALQGDLTVLRFANQSSGSTTIVQGGVTFTVNGSFSLEAGGTVDIQTTGVLDAREAGSFSNFGLIVENGSGKVLRGATSLDFTDSLGVPITSISSGADFYVTLVDEDENLDGLTAESSEVTVRSLTTGDSVALTLTETGEATEEFRNTSGLPTAPGEAVPDDGILQYDGSENLEVTYTDNEDSADVISQSLTREPIVWDGGGTDNRWETAENWSGDRAPGPSDSVIFDDTSSRDAIVTQLAEMFDLTITAQYGGTLSLSGNSVITINGDYLQEGGSVNWDNNFAHFRGNFSRTGGQSTGVTGDIFFDGSGLQSFNPGPGGMRFSELIASGAQSPTLTILGDLEVDDFVTQSAGLTVDLSGGITFTVIKDFALAASAVLNIESGAVLDARQADGFDNQGTINEVGTGKVLRDASSLEFTDAAGAPRDQIAVGASLFLTLSDDDENLSGDAVDVTEVVVSSMTTGDSETLTLDETDLATAEFRNTEGLPTASGEAQPGDGILQHDGSENLRAVYTDGEDPEDTIIGFLVAVSEIEVFDGDVLIADGGGPIDFGSVFVGESALSRTFTVINAGTLDLRISNLTVTAPFVITEGLDATIPPGAFDTFTVQISAGAAGTFDGTVSFANNDDDENPFDFSITATITLPSIQITPEALDFGIQEPGQGPTSVMDVTISNAGGAPLNFTGNQVELTGNDAAEFTIVSDTGESTLLFGSTRTVGIVFDPSTIGMKSAELTVTSDDPSGFDAGVSLTGTGIEEQIVVSPLSLDFGEHDLDDGPTAGMDITIINNATTPLTFTGNEIEVTGVHGDQFAVLADTGESILSPGSFRTVTLGFDPSSLGTKSGVLTITSDDANDAIVSVTFTGTGIDQEVDVDSSSLAFGSQAIGEGPTASMQVTVANIGTNTLAFTGSQIELTGSDAAAFTISSDSAEPSLAPGLSRVIMLAFDPSSEGEKEALLVIHTDDTTELTVGVELSGTGTDQEIDVTPLSVGFGTNDVRQGASADITVIIVNIGTHDLTMTGNEVELTGADATEFIVTSDTGEKVLAPGVERIVKVAFDPVTVGSKNANLTITSDDLDEPVLTVLFTAGGVEQDLLITGGPLDFGGRDVDEGVSDPLSVTILNLGEDFIGFTDTAISITGASAADFDFATPPDTSPLASGEERVLSVVFTPSSLGSKSGTLVTVSTDAGVASIALLGEGTDQEITASPLSVDFGIAKIVTGEGASPEAVTIRNAGRSVLRIDETSFEFLGDNPADFLIANASELDNLNRGEELELILVFIPTDTGPRSAVLRISTGQSDRPTIDVQLSGIGAVSTGAGFSWALYE